MDADRSRAYRAPGMSDRGQTDTQTGGPNRVTPLVELVRAQQRARMRLGQLAACDLDPQDVMRRAITVRADLHAERIEREAAVAAARARLGIMVRGR